MNASFKPQIEMLEGRELMDAAAMHAVVPDMIAATVQVAEAEVPRAINLSAFAGQTVGLQIAALTSATIDPAPANDNEWIYVPVRRMDADMDNQHGTHVAGTIGAVGNNGIGASHELGHALGFRHEHTRPS